MSLEENNPNPTVGMKKGIFTLVSIGFLLTQLQSQNVEEKRYEKTDRYVKTMLDSLEIIGLNYAILIDNKVVHKRSFGVANAQLQAPMTLDRSFPVASISKLFSSTALLKLMYSQNRTVDEKVQDFLPNRTDLPSSWRNLTIKQLLSHTSGIPDQIDYGIYLAPESEAFLIESMKDKPFSSEPGTESKYNATGFLLVRMLIERLANKDFESYMQQEYFNKLGLTSAVYGGFKKVVSNRVTCYQNRDGELEMFPLNYSSPMYAGAGLNITMNDLIKWFQAVQNNQILTKEQLGSIWTPVKLKNGKDGYFALGWESVRLQGGYRFVGHGGAGISTFRHYWNEKTDENVTVILLTNGAKNWTVRPNQINAKIATMVLSE